MARSHAVWVVYDKHYLVVAAFTVKHELLTWLDKNRDHTFERFPDGPPPKKP